MIFRQLAVNAGNGKHTALSSFYKRIRARSGKMVAIKATARKIAVYFYNLMTKGLQFVEEGIKKYEARYYQQQEKFLQRKANEMGYVLVKP
jgi:transposase